MRLCRGLSACVFMTAAALAFELSDPGLATDDHSISLSAELTVDAQSQHARHKSDLTKHKCKKNLPKLKATPADKSRARGPMPGAGAVRGNFEDLSTMSSLHPNFWVRNILANITVDPKWKKNSDCFYDLRSDVRHYPNIPGEECYTNEFNRRMTAWWKFWPEIRGDLQYAFDFVMWDEYEQYHETNSFWYLMLYLKTLLQRVSNPNDILSNSGSKRPPKARNQREPTTTASPTHSPTTVADEQTSNCEHTAEMNEGPPTGDGTLPPSDDADIKKIIDMLAEYEKKLDQLETLMMKILQ